MGSKCRGERCVDALHAQEGRYRCLLLGVELHCIDNKERGHVALNAKWEGCNFSEIASLEGTEGK